MLVMASMPFTVMANSLEDMITNSNHVLIGDLEPVEGLGTVPNYIMTKEGTFSYGYSYDVQNVGEYQLTTVNDDLIVSLNNFSFESTIYINVFDEAEREKWGDLVMDQLQSAVEQGLIPSAYSYSLTRGIKEISLSDYDNSDGNVTLESTSFQTLIIPQNVIDEINGGWKGPEEIEIISHNDAITKQLKVVNDNSLVTIDRFLDKQWLLPLITDIQFFDEEELSKVNDLSGDISSGVSTSEILNIPINVSYTNNVVEVSTQDEVYRYLPHKKSGEDIEVIVKVFEEGELVKVYSDFLVEKKGNTQNFTKHISTTFPFVQLSYLNGRNKSYYDEDGLLSCFSIFSYVFSKDNSLERGIMCDDESQELIYGDNRDWTWSTDEGGNVHQNLELPSLSYSRQRVWLPLSSDDYGFTRVLEYSTLKFDSSRDGIVDQDGYLIRPRLNVIKLEDLSQFETFYNNAGFQGDFDGDGLSDTLDTDDDNDGMSDYYENKYSLNLNHLDASDAGVDSDFDGLTNLQEFKAGTDPSLRDTDGDGVTDARDSDPLDPTTSSFQRVFDIRYFGDVTGDRIWDYYVATKYEDGYEVVIRSPLNDEVVQTLFWNKDYKNAQVIDLDDLNGDGIGEIGLFGFVEFVGENDSLQKAQLFVKDPVSGETVVVHNWPGNWSDVEFISVTDANNDGVTDVAIQGKFKDGNRPQLFVRDAVTSEKLALHSYPSFFSGANYSWFSDFDGDGTRDVSMIGQIPNGKIQVKISSGIDGTKIGSYNFPANYSDFSWRNAGDIDEDGHLDYGLLAKRLDDGRVQFFTKSGKSHVGTLGIYSWPDMIDFELFRVRDLTDDDHRDYALVGYRKDTSRYQMIVKNGRDRNHTISSTGWPDNWEEVSFLYMGDVNRDEVRSTEIGLYGQHKVTGRWQIAIRSSAGASVGQIEVGAEWDSKPDVYLSHMLAYGEVDGVMTVKNLTVDFYE